MLSEEAKLLFFEDRIEAVPLTNGGMAYIQRPMQRAPNPKGEGVLGADEDTEKSYTCTYRVSVGPMEITLTCRPIAMMGADVDVDVDMVVALKLPLRELAVPVGSVSGTLGTGYNTGNNTTNNDGGNDNGIQLKVAHPSIEGGVVGLRLVRLADASGALEPGPDHDIDHDRDHDTGHDSAAILHWNVSAFERSYVDSLKLFCVAGV